MCRHQPGALEVSQQFEEEKPEHCPFCFREALQGRKQGICPSLAFATQFSTRRRQGDFHLTAVMWVAFDHHQSFFF